jgi:GMP synthase-like glutamine amidotransferase
MRVHFIQHVPFEGLGYIESWLLQRKHSITCTKTWQHDAFPSSDQYDALIIMGGPMGVYDDQIYPWLRIEKKVISDTIKTDKVVIGICLGAQLIASVCGASVNANIYKEIGWFPIGISPSFAAWLECEVPKDITVFHWHGDRFQIPANAVNHASSEACDNQLFTIGDKIVAIQFHPEATAESIQSLIENDGSSLIAETYVQDAETIIQHSSHFKQTNDLMARILTRLIH